MTASLKSLQPKVAHTCDTILARVETDLIIQKPNFSFYLVLQGMGFAAGETLELTINGQEFIFEFRDPEDAQSCYHLPAYNASMVLLDYAQILIEAFSKIYYFTCNFDIQRGNSGANVFLIFRLKKCEDLEVQYEYSGDPQSYFTFIDFGGVVSQDIYLEQNLSSFLTISKADRTFDDGDKIIELEAAYNKETAEACFQIEKAFCLGPHLPYIGIDPPKANPTIAYDSFCKYVISIADKFGDPPQIDCLEKNENEFIAIHCLKSCERSSNFFAKNLTALHTYDQCKRNDKYIKLVGKDQPDWIYFYLKNDSDLSINIDYTLLDGNTGNHTIQPSTVTPGCAVYYLPTGHDQLDLGSISDQIVQYTYNLTDGKGNTISVCYELDCECHPNKCYLVFDNGCGGVESVYLRGRKKIEIDIDRKTAKRIDSKSFSTTDPKTFVYYQDGKLTYKLNTGNHPENEIFHITQLLHGQAWLYFDGRFIPVETVTSKISEPDEEDKIWISGSKGWNFDIDLVVDECCLVEQNEIDCEVFACQSVLTEVNFTSNPFLETQNDRHPLINNYNRSLPTGHPNNEAFFNEILAIVSSEQNCNETVEIIEMCNGLLERFLVIRNTDLKIISLGDDNSTHNWSEDCDNLRRC